MYFHPLLKKWQLEHYQMDDGLPARNLMEFIQKRKIEKRDRLLVKKKDYQTSFLKDPWLQKETWEDKRRISLLSLARLFLPQND